MVHQVAQERKESREPRASMVCLVLLADLGYQEQREREASLALTVVLEFLE